MKRIDLATTLRRRLTDANTRHAIMAALGWDGSNVSRFLAGQAGIPLDKLDAAIQSVGYVPVERQYLSAMQTFCVVGSQCECALAGQGACGIDVQPQKNTP
ncbi:DNA-binding protein [Cardiobacteriales bacterium ML27]|uniref:DNA-binding protein n=2 Tax=Ostreibacterium oceani TaxID=2654998 RepID=A0A6N7EWJ8_9GAMM|nr:DNA-binding protein [Ostreibacterium oceani]